MRTNFFIAPYTTSTPEPTPVLPPFKRVKFLDIPSRYMQLIKGTKYVPPESTKWRKINGS